MLIGYARDARSWCLSYHAESLGCGARRNNWIVLHECFGINIGIERGAAASGYIIGS